MKKWYQWFTLSLIFAIGGLLNYLDGKRIIAAVIQVSITIILGFMQFFFDQKGEKGRKAFGHLCIVTTVLLIIWMIYLVLNALR